MSGQCDQDRARAERMHCFGCLGRSSPRHPNVDDSHVRMVSAHQIEQGRGGGSRTEHLEAGLVVEELNQRTEEPLVIVGDNDGYGRVGRHSSHHCAWSQGTGHQTRAQEPVLR